MIPQTLRTGRLLTATGVALLVAACGGGGGGDDGVAMNGDVPVTAIASVEAYSDFTATLSGASAETGEPLDLATVVPPTSESAEPAVLR